MLFRKLFAAFLVFLFVIVAIPNFFINALSRTYLNAEFYKDQTFSGGVYDFVLDKTNQALIDESKILKGFFSKEELKKQVSSVFTEKVFSVILDDFAKQLYVYKADTSKSLAVSLKPLRESLLTVANNLTYIIYQDLPTCSNDEIVELRADVVPSCVPKTANYDQVVKPILDDFETSVYGAVPEELGNIDKAVPLEVMLEIANYRNLTFILLVFLIGMIALVLWKPISLIVSYVGAAIFLGGAAGLGVSYVLDNILDFAKIQTNDAKFLDLMHFLLGLLAQEMIKMAWLFLIVGIALYAIKFVLVKTIDNK